MTSMLTKVSEKKPQEPIIPTTPLQTTPTELHAPPTKQEKGDNESNAVKPGQQEPDPKLSSKLESAKPGPKLESVKPGPKLESAKPCPKQESAKPGPKQELESAKPGLKQELESAKPGPKQQLESAKPGPNLEFESAKAGLKVELKSEETGVGPPSPKPVTVKSTAVPDKGGGGGVEGGEGGGGGVGGVEGKLAKEQATEEEAEEKSIGGVKAESPLLSLSPRSSRCAELEEVTKQSSEMEEESTTAMEEQVSYVWAFHDMQSIGMRLPYSG